MDATFFKFWDKVAIGDGCWYRDGNVLATGYGLFYVSPSKTESAHRYAYQSMVGPVPPGMILDHLCHNDALERGECDGGRSCRHRQCVRPDHMAPVTYRENSRRGGLGKAAMSRPCVRGHVDWRWSEAQQRFICKECRRLQQRERRQRIGPS